MGHEIQLCNASGQNLHLFPARDMWATCTSHPKGTCDQHPNAQGTATLLGGNKAKSTDSLAESGCFFFKLFLHQGTLTLTVPTLIAQQVLQGGGLGTVKKPSFKSSCKEPVEELSSLWAHRGHGRASSFCQKQAVHSASCPGWLQDCTPAAFLPLLHGAALLVIALQQSDGRQSWCAASPRRQLLK